MEILIKLILVVSQGLIFSAATLTVVYLVYLVEVKNHSFDFHLRILKKFKNRMEKKSHENKIDGCLEKYYTLVIKPTFLNIIIPLLIVIIIGFLLYQQMIFFAVIGSGSMEPTFKKNDLILMHNINVEVDSGDIIMFKTRDVIIPVTHRVIGVSENKIFTKGDARRFQDDWIVEKDQIMGKAITITNKPIIVKDVGIYFIENVESAIKMSRYDREFGFIRKVINSIQSLGLMIFFFAIFMYILSSFKS